VTIAIFMVRTLGAGYCSNKSSNFAHHHEMNRTSKRPTLAELEAVTAVARARSVRGGARELGASPSALSHSISSLESRLRVRLFRRSTRSVTLTDEGAAFVARAAQALAVLDRAVDDASERSGVPSGTLRVVAPRGPAWTTILPAVLEMRGRHPDVTVELVTETRTVDIVAEGYDAGVRYAGMVPGDMVAVPCSSDRHVAIVAAPSYFKRHPPPRSPRDLAEHECVRYRKDGSPVRRWALVVGGRERAVDVDGHLVLDDEAFLLDAALAGAGLAYVMHASAAPHLATGRLVRVLERYSPRFEPLQLFYPSRSYVRAALRAFIDIVKERRRGTP
jgi:DNA-binding transcriptional LysR family regulator